MTEQLRRVNEPDRREQRIKSRILTQPASRSERRAAAVVLTHGELFMLSLKSGDVPWELPHGLGVFYRDCRFLDA
jgi:hypothetical protein